MSRPLILSTRDGDGGEDGVCDGAGTSLPEIMVIAVTSSSVSAEKGKGSRTKERLQSQSWKTRSV